MKAAFSLGAALAATFSVAYAAQPTCGPGSNCPADSPCCSQYGQCGAGAYCLGGCDPQYSFSLQSCVAAPVCKSGNYKLTSMNDVAPNTKFLGDSNKYNWVSSGTPVQYGDSLLLTMPPSTVGTLFSSTHYVWYGKISAKLTTSQGAGVVTAFILMSDVKDEIDFEFVGVDLNHAQSNYYYQGITDYRNGANLTVSNTVQNEHTYTIDWSPDQITWGIDGQVMRTLKRSDTYNETTKSYHYPQTPARVQLSLWPAGLESNGKGTIEWAGGLVDWNSPLMQNGYYFARVHEINVDCYNPPSSFNKKNGDKVYYYTSTAGTEDTIAMGNNNTILSSFYASGDNPSYCPGGCASASGSQTATTAAATMSSVPETIPGISGGGNAGNSGSTSGSDTSGNAENSANGNVAAGAGGSGSNNGGGSTSFSQGTTPIQQQGTASKTLSGSIMALVAFGAAALIL